MAPHLRQSHFSFQLRRTLQRLEHGGGEALGQLGDLVIKLASRFAFPIRTGQSSEAARGRFIPVRGNEKSIILTIPVIRSVGGNGTPERFEVDSQISDDLIRQERHQIGITRKPRIVFGKRLHAGSGPAELVMSFKQEHGPGNWKCIEPLGRWHRADQPAGRRACPRQ